jgi:hypothetical protein
MEDNEKLIFHLLINIFGWNLVFSFMWFRSTYLCLKILVDMFIMAANLHTLSHVNHMGNRQTSLFMDRCWWNLVLYYFVWLKKIGRKFLSVNWYRLLFSMTMNFAITAKSILSLNLSVGLSTKFKSNYKGYYQGL